MVRNFSRSKLCEMTSKYSKLESVISHKSYMTCLKKCWNKLGKRYGLSGMWRKCYKCDETPSGKKVMKRVRLLFMRIWSRLSSLYRRNATTCQPTTGCKRHRHKMKTSMSVIQILNKVHLMWTKLKSSLNSQRTQLTSPQGNELLPKRGTNQNQLQSEL